MQKNGQMIISKNEMPPLCCQSMGRAKVQTSASRPETFGKLFMASVRASVALREPANTSLHRTGFWSSSSGK